MTAADQIRRAAARLRELAEGATPGPWMDCAHGWIESVSAESAGVIATASARDEDAAYIAALGPDVGSALADWLDGVALFMEALDEEEWLDLDGDPIAPEDTHAIGSALAVARKILGES